MVFPCSKLIRERGKRGQTSDGIYFTALPTVWPMRAISKPLGCGSRSVIQSRLVCVINRHSRDPTCIMLHSHVSMCISSLCTVFGSGNEYMITRLPKWPTPALIPALLVHLCTTKETYFEKPITFLHYTIKCQSKGLAMFSQ